MITILDTIVEHKRMEVLKRKGKKPLEALEHVANYNRTPLDPTQYLKSGSPGIS